MQKLEDEILDLIFEHSRRTYEQGYDSGRGDYDAQLEEFVESLATQIREKIHDLVLQVDHSNLVVETAKEKIEEQDDYKAWYEEAMVASNEAGCVGMSAAETIRYLAYQVEVQAPPVDTLDARDSFEEWAQNNYCSKEDLLRKRVTGYGFPELNHMYRGWSACMQYLRNKP